MSEAFDPGSGPFTLDEVRQLLKALDRLPGKVANVDGISDIAIVPCLNGKVAPASQVVWPASKEEADMFELLVDGLLIADSTEIESLCPGLRDVCPPLDVSRAAHILKGVDVSTLTVLSDELLNWLSRNLSAIDSASRALLSALPIFPTASGSFAPLSTLSLPDTFHDPINVATLVDESTARDYHRLLTTLGAAAAGRCGLLPCPCPPRSRRAPALLGPSGSASPADCDSPGAADRSSKCLGDGAAGPLS